jgi:hypothetical protein
MTTMQVTGHEPLTHVVYGLQNCKLGKMYKFGTAYIMTRPNDPPVFPRGGANEAIAPKSRYWENVVGFSPDFLFFVPRGENWLHLTFTEATPGTTVSFIAE